jgi:hypothetical protein
VGGGDFGKIPPAEGSREDVVAWDVRMGRNGAGLVNTSSTMTGLCPTSDADFIVSGRRGATVCPWGGVVPLRLETLSCSHDIESASSFWVRSSTFGLGGRKFGMVGNTANARIVI